MYHLLVPILLSVFVVGCASQDDLKEYSSGRPVDTRLAELGLPEATDASINVLPIGQLVNGMAAVFATTEEKYYLVALASPLGGVQGDQVYLVGGSEIVAGDSIVTMNTARKTKFPVDKKGMYRSPFGDARRMSQADVGGAYRRKESIIRAVFQLRNKDHAQEIADLLYR